MNRTEANQLVNLFQDRQRLLDNLNTINGTKGLSVQVSICNSGFPLFTTDDAAAMKGVVIEQARLIWTKQLADTESAIRELGGTW